MGGDCVEEDKWMLLCYIREGMGMNDFEDWK